MGNKLTGQVNDIGYWKIQCRPLDRRGQTERHVIGYACTCVTKQILCRLFL